jgi:glycosyltransferase involved in cell wall biosynthesis
MPKPFVSVLIDTYNHERFIEEAVCSVLSQDFPSADREIVVVDDGSTDSTPEILKKFQPHIRLLRKENGGQASAFNTGIPECHGQIISFLDGDDWWLSQKLSRVAALMEADPSIGTIGHGIIQVSSTSMQRFARESDARFRLDSVTSAEFFRFNRSYLGTSRLTLRTAIARKILPVPDSLVFEADEYLFTVAPLFADAIILRDALTCYRAHGSNLFLSAGGTQRGERDRRAVLIALARELRRALREFGVEEEVSSVLLEMVELEAAQSRLQMEGGFPWETFRTEIALYRIQHPAASFRSKAFRAMSMAPALLLPPRLFYSCRQWLGLRPWYRRARQQLIPIPKLVVPASPDTVSKEIKN